MSETKYQTVPPAIRKLRDLWRRLEGEINNRLSQEDKWRELNRCGATYQVSSQEDLFLTKQGVADVLMVRFRLKFENTLTDFLARVVKIHLDGDGQPVYRFGDHELRKETVIALAAIQLTNGLNEQKGRRMQ